MPYLIDGHNLIPRVPGLSLADPEDELELIKRLEAFCLRSGKRAEVFFDNAPAGQPRVQSFGPVRAEFIRAGNTADAAIRRRLRSLGRSAANWTVISSDREVQAAARQARARVLEAKEFAALLAGGRAPQRHGAEGDAAVPPGEVEEWLRLFGEDE